jgi:hypothetical protein
MSGTPTDAADAKILAAARMYLEVFRVSPDKTEEFLDGLHTNLGWSPSEIVAVELRVADILLGQLSSAGCARAES